MEKVEHAVKIGKEKLQETIEVDHWNHFIDTHLNPVWAVADNDVKDAARRVTAAKTRLKKETEAGNLANDEGSDVAGPEVDED